MRQIKVTAHDRPLGPTPDANRKSSAKKKTRAKKSTAQKLSIVEFLGQTSAAVKNRVSNSFAFLSKLKLKKKSRSAQSSSRRKSGQAWGKIAAFGGVVTSVSLMVGYLGYLVVTHNVIDRSVDWVEEKRLQALGGVGLVVQEVSVVGRERTPVDQLMAALNVSRGTSILDFDPDAARHRIEKLGWIEEASVMRRYPDEIFIRIIERRPFARWQTNGRTVVIDRKGEVVAKRDYNEFKHLPKVVGFGANEKAAELFDMLAKSPALFTRLQNAVRIRDRRWDLEFSNGVKVLLPEEGTAHAWARLEQLQESRKILNKGVMAIDLRNGDRMFVKLRPGDAEYRRESFTKSETQS
ncbi:cell division protein FtsQ/DivIB [Sneathiella glossodoripedis]|uniref:cell division protein FtsQ/DivIB n=1 Tax=Sneathiella glossodoripedis TaxID=418853 RepID=UPI0004703E05|nr:cell division protein FtsQ/DivIB [Sneathiella glossodoripedis]